MRILLLILLLVPMMSFGQVDSEHQKTKISIGDTIELTKEVKKEYYDSAIKGTIFKKDKKTYLKVKDVSIDSKYYSIIKTGEEENPNESQFKSIILEEHQFNSSQVFETGTIIYYGLDFSSFQLVNGKKVGTEDVVKKYFPYWITMFEKHFEMKKEKSLSPFFYKNVVFKSNTINQNFKELGGNWIAFSGKTLNLDAIKKTINNYTLEYKQDNSIGFVVIPESFKKKTETAIVNFVFFEPSNNQVLWSIKIESSTGKGGMKNHWGKSLEKSFNRFLNLYKKTSYNNGPSDVYYVGDKIIFGVENKIYKGTIAKKSRRYDATVYVNNISEKINDKWVLKNTKGTNVHKNHITHYQRFHTSH